MQRLSVIIICYNEEENIGECLASVKWCDDIIVMDSFSTDRTVEIIKQNNARLFQNAWEGFSKQRKLALEKAENKWVFVIDADERCSDELKEEIKDFLKTNTEFDGCRIPRKSFFLGKWIKHSGWYPDYKLRLFNKDNITVSENLVHERYDVTGKVKTFKSDLQHFTVRRLSEFITKINHYSTLSAAEKQNRNVNYISLLYRPLYSFLREYIIKLGFLDGIHGLLVAYFNMVTNIFTYAKIWEIKNRK